MSIYKSQTNEPTNDRILVFDFHNFTLGSLRWKQQIVDMIVKHACVFGARLASYRVKQRLLHVATLQSNNQWWNGIEKKKQMYKCMYVSVCCVQCSIAYFIATAT